MDEIDEWTVGPIPIRPAPGPAAPRPSPDDAGARPVPSPEPRIPDSSENRPAASDKPPVQRPRLKGLSHARTPEIPDMPPLPSRAPSRDSMPSVAPAPAPIRPEPSSFVAASPESVRDGLEAVADIPPETHGIPRAAVIVCCSVVGAMLVSAIAGGCVVAAGLDTAAVKADRSAKTAKTSVKAIRTAVKAVEASKLDKTVDDASRLLKDSEGKVQDARTRETLSKAIKARDAVAIAKAVKAVNDSKAAKEKADAEAKAKAEQEAAKRKAEEESAAEPQQSQNVQRQTAGTGQGRAQRQESVQTPSTTQRQQQPSTPSAPSWSVPSENDDGGMPDTDPGL